MFWLDVEQFRHFDGDHDDLMFVCSVRSSFLISPNPKEPRCSLKISFFLLPETGATPSQLCGNTSHPVQSFRSFCRARFVQPSWQESRMALDFW